VVQGDMPLLSPNIALHVQISSQKTAPQGVNAYRQTILSSQGELGELRRR
jgi:hypothetical protein